MVRTDHIYASNMVTMKNCLRFDKESLRAILPSFAIFPEVGAILKSVIYLLTLLLTVVNTVHSYNQSINHYKS